MADFHDDLMVGFHDDLMWLVSDFMAHILFTDPMRLIHRDKSGLAESHTGKCLSLFDNYLRRLLWMFCAGQAGVKGNNRADRLGVGLGQGGGGRVTVPACKFPG